MQDFHYGYSLLSTLYGITIGEEEYEEIALLGFDLIGNKRTILCRDSVCPVNGIIELPCDADDLEAITTNWEDWNHVSNISDNGDLESASTEQYIEARKKFNDPHYIQGKFIPYERVGNTIKIDPKYGRVNILYKTLLLDDNGLPMITDKEAMALATYVAYIVKFKEGILTNNANTIQLANTLKAQWTTLVDQARNDYYMSLNEWDQVLDANSRWDRKIHNVSFKPYH